MKKISSLFCALVCLFCATSCLNNSDPQTITEQAFTSCFARVVDMTQMSEASYDNVSYKLLLNYSNLTADVIISGLKTPDGVNYPTISLKGIKWTIEEGSKIVVKGNELIPDMSGFAVVPLFNSFRLELINRTIGDLYYPGFSVNFTLNSRYSVMSALPSQIMLAKTTSTSDNGDVYTTTTTQYALDFNVLTGRLKITLYGARFIESMPAMDIVFDNIPFTFSGGKAVWTVDALTPMINDKPFSGFPITNLTGSLNFCGDYNLDFTCDPVTAPGSYAVKAEGSFSYVPGA